ncbi:AsnC family transcriptional regulator [Kitasatospora acidiphila]|uniref:AsnC family transcriptional regulator n=1 Tax=Kitasatospora acidiphila TaxID=2567942 RepID=A0A540WCM3_9ACTN|nr:AsnC family transcriptional regulator [Kitasatospora acidiphila]TQF06637.1 AsnC family transcriptional regulator [Kitasatospora acidiphila]
MRTSELDALDQALVQALLIDGRAPFSQLAEVLGVSDQTVIRRYRRLRGEGLVRVVGLPVGPRVGLVESWLRLQCPPDAALAVADALARRPDIAWVTLNSGGTEVQCITRARTREDHDELLLRRLPRTRRVTAITAHSILRAFIGGPQYWRGLDLLTEEQLGKLTVPVYQLTGPVLHLDAADEAMLAVLARDGRTGYPELARAAGLSESTARRRLDQLRERSACYFDVEIDPRLLGLESRATLMITVAPGELAAAGAALSEHPEVPFAAAVTGTANLIAVVLCRDNDELYRYLTERIGALAGVQHVEVVPQLRSIKRAGMMLDGYRLVDPPSA